MRRRVEAVAVAAVCDGEGARRGAVQARARERGSIFQKGNCQNESEREREETKKKKGKKKRLRSTTTFNLSHLRKNGGRGGTPDTPSLPASDERARVLTVLVHPELLFFCFLSALFSYSTSVAVHRAVQRGKADPLLRR